VLAQLLTFNSAQKGLHCWYSHCYFFIIDVIVYFALVGQIANSKASSSW
jgi:hypothetical protein